VEGVANSGSTMASEPSCPKLTVTSSGRIFDGTPMPADAGGKSARKLRGEFMP